MTSRTSGASGDCVSWRIARHVTSFRPDDIPPEVARRTKLSLLDQLGVCLAASGLGDLIGPFLYLARSAGDGPATILGHSFTAPAPAAAFANGAMAHALDFEDTHDETLVHPYAAVFPAALAVAEELRASGRDFLTAVLVGADLSCRIARAFRVDPEKAGRFSLLPMIGAFGATAAVARLLSLTPGQTIQAFATSMSRTTVSSAYKRYELSHFRAVRDAFNAEAAITAGTLARHGFEMFDRPFEGPDGYFPLLAGGQYDPETLVDDLGSRFENVDTSFKIWPCCRGTHAFVEAALELAREPGVSPDAIRAIEVEVPHRFASLCEPREMRIAPRSAPAAKFSIPFTTAAALTRGRVTLVEFGPEALHDTQILRLASLVRCKIRDDAGASSELEGAVRIELDDGRRLDSRVHRPRGHVENPVTEEEIREKFFSCAAAAAVPLGEETIAAVVRAVERLEELDSIDALTSLLRVNPTR